MNTSIKIAACLAAAIATGACSTKPRTFSATVRPAAFEGGLALQAEDRVYAECDRLVRAGHKGNFLAAAGSTGAGFAAAAATTGTVVLNGAVAPGFMAVSTAAAAAVPVIGILASVGTSRLIRSGREKSYRNTMAACFAENGYEVVDWERMKKKQVATARLLPANPAMPMAAAIEPAAEVEVTPAAASEPPASDPALALGGA